MSRICRMGSDARLLLAGNALAAEGWEVISGVGCSSEEAVYLFAPRAGEAELLALLVQAEPKRGSLILPYRASERVKRFCAERGLFCVALWENEEYRRVNTAATVKGVLAEMLAKTGRLLSEEKILVCGWGQCGSRIGECLRLCGADVAVFSREGSAARAAEAGFDAFSDWEKASGVFDEVVNTIEDAVFSPAAFRCFSPGCRLFQVASGFSGLCAETLLTRGVTLVPLPSLPARYAPESEARVMAEIIRREWKKTR